MSRPARPADPLPTPQQVQAAVAQMRSDPRLSEVLRSPRLRAALDAVRRDPAALARFAGDGEVMGVLGRLLEAQLAPEDVLGLQATAATPQRLLTSLAGDPALLATLSAPHVRQALADIRADPEGGWRRWQHDAAVMGALQQMEAALAPGAGPDAADRGRGEPGEAGRWS